MAKFQEEMRRQRKIETYQSWFEWDDDEDKKVIDKLDNMSIDDIAKELKRTPNGIRRISMNALKMIEEEDKTLADVLKRFKLRRMILRITRIRRR